MVRAAEQVDRVVEGVAQAAPVGAVASRVAALARKVLPPGPVKDTLSGTPLGHPVHPVLVTGTVGMLVGVSLLDAFGERRAAQRLLGAGILAAVPTAATGASDWSDTMGVEQRVGLLHAAANYGAIGLYAVSWFARRRGEHGKGAALALAASGGLTVGGWLGGHLAYAYGVGVDTTSFAGGPADWADVAAAEDLRDGRPHAVEVDGVSIVVLRHRGALTALRNRCTHRGGPLSDGPLVDGCLECPWHGSRFDVATGSVERGPATRPQSVYEVRERGGRVEVRRADTRTLRTNPVAAG